MCREPTSEFCSECTNGGSYNTQAILEHVSWNLIPSLYSYVHECFLCLVGEYSILGNTFVQTLVTASLWLPGILLMPSLCLKLCHHLGKVQRAFNPSTSVVGEETGGISVNLRPARSA